MSLLRDESFDLVISDILMPVMDGFKLCYEIRADARLRDLPILIFTGTYINPQDEALALRCGADRFLMKPCEPEKFLAVLQEMSESAGRPHASPDAAAPEEEVLLLYNNRLVRKLEDKMLQLQREVASRCEAEGKIRRHVERLKALVSLLQQRPTSLQDFLEQTMDKAIQLTSSTIGFINLYDDKQQHYQNICLSREVPRLCRVGNSTGFFHLDRAGLWGEAARKRRPIVINDFQADHPLKRGYPEEHIRLERFLALPVVHEDRVVAVVGVANKHLDYDENDTLTLTLLMEAVWQSVQAMHSTEALHRIEWLLDSRRPVGRAVVEQSYGNLADLNTTGLIRNSVSHATLADSVSDFLDLVETSAAIYEKNGDYAYQTVTSGWCRLLSAASRRFCPGEDDKQAMVSGCWLCHESCWTDTARLAVESGRSMDRECAGGLRTCAEPVCVDDQVIGAMVFCYGDPPHDTARLKEIADRFLVDENELRARAEDYESRPPFIIDVAKRRLEVSARLLGKMIELRQAEEALRESELRYRTLFENSLDGIMLTAPDGRVFSANPAACRMLGYTEEELRLLGREGVVDSSDPNLARLLAERQERGTAAGELTFRRSDGTTVPVEISSVIFTDQRGRLSANMILRDISERRRIAKALRIERERMDFVVRAAEVGIWELNVQTGENVFNESWAALIGYTLEELQPHEYATWSRLVHPDDFKEVEPLLQRCMQGIDSFYEAEFRMCHKNGEWRWILSRGRVMTYDPAGRPLAMYGIHIDVTERRRVTDQLRQEQEYYRDLVDTAPGGIYRIRIRPEVGRPSNDFFPFQLVHDLISPRYCYILSLDRQTLESCPESVAARIHIDDRADFVQACLEALEKLQTFSWQGRLDKDGEIAWVSFDAIPRLLDDGDVLFTGILTDITARKRAEQDQEELKAQLAQAQRLESVGLLAGGVAHDFNNALGVILGYAEMALGRVDESSPLHEALSEIYSSARRSTEITQQLLTFSRQQNVHPHTLSLNEVVGRVSKMLGRLIGEDITLLCRQARDLWPVRMDPGQIEQVLVNLCVNARDAITGFGTIAIETENVTVDEAASSMMPGSRLGDFAVLSVRDDGCGMDKEICERSFEPFFTTKELGKGTGLGLAIVYGIIQQNNGFILVDSKRSRGTTFRIYLPRHSDSQPVPAMEESKAASCSLQGETVLVVEDDPFLRKLVTQMLLELGYVPLVADSPAEALILTEQHGEEIQVLLTDIIMPKMHGRELADRIMGLYPRIRTIFMSGYTAGIISSKGASGPELSFLQKPFSVMELSEALRGAVAQK